MSFTFTLDLSGSRAPRLARLQAELGVELGTVESVDVDAHLSGLVHVFRAGVSTRALEIEAGAARLGVRVLICSSAEDHELALAIVRAAAADAGIVMVAPEDDEPFPVDELERRYGARWAAEQLAGGVAAVARTVDDNPGKLVTLVGPVRPFHIGDRLLAELRGAGPPDELADRLIDAMRRTQWPGDYHAASVIQVRGGPSGRAIRLAVLSGGTRTLLPDTDAVALRAGDAQKYVRPAALAELLSDRARYLDERHLLVERVDEIAWRDLLQRAAPHAVELDDL